MNIVLIEPFYTGSHKVWADNLIKYSSHNIRLLSLEGRNWKWRMHGAAVTLAKEFMKLDYTPDLILATDMLDLGIFISLTREKSNNIPVYLYFHENQLTYPWSPDDPDTILKRDAHYAFINYTSSLVADKIFFNSEYNMNSFLTELPRFLNLFPDYNEIQNVDFIKKKSTVLPLGIDFERFNKYKRKYENDKPLILWNHRWEFDKNPSEFFEALYFLEKKGVEFEVAILGEYYRKIPEEFNKAKNKLSSKIVKFGYAESFSEYADWLWRSDIALVTSIQEFFGISVMEAAYCNTEPLVPNRLTYPQLFDYANNSEYFYHDFNELIQKLEKICINYNNKENSVFKRIASKYDWSEIIHKYDNLLDLE